MRSWDWDDYKFFSAIAHAGSIRGAATALKVNPSTVTRRLETLERRLGVELFSRQASGLVITQRGRDVANRIDRIGQELGAIEDELREVEGKVTGEVAVLMPDALAMFVTPRLHELADLYPDLDIELVNPSRVASHGDVDVWVLATEQPPQSLIGRQLGRPELGLFIRRDLHARIGDLIQSGELHWLGFEAEELGPDFEPPLRDPGYSALPVRLHTRSILHQLWALQAGLGLGVLPMWLSALASDLVSLPTAGRSFGKPLWLLTRPESRRVRRLQIVADWLRSELSGRDLGIAKERG